jgi:hypothetical protein
MTFSSDFFKGLEESRFITQQDSFSYVIYTGEEN